LFIPTDSGGQEGRLSQNPSPQHSPLSALGPGSARQSKVEDVKKKFKEQEAAAHSKNLLHHSG
jgi:hypothetical protein